MILAVTSALIGLIFAIRPEAAESSELVEATERQGTRTIWGGFVSFLAVGCPVCNQAVVALVGVGGALSWWAPVQPFVAPSGGGAAALHPAQASQHLQAHRLPGPRVAAGHTDAAGYEGRGPLPLEATGAVLSRECPDDPDVQTDKV